MNENKMNDNLSEMEPNTPISTEEAHTTNLNEFTQEIPVLTPTKPTKRKRSPWIWYGILFIVFCLAVAIYGGYKNGVSRRLANEKNMIMSQISVQLSKAYQDIENKNYENAKVRLEYILQKYPGFPGVDALLVDVMMQLGAQAVTTPNPSVVDNIPSETVATPLPTLDPQIAATMYANIQQQINGKQWELALESIRELKEKDYTFRSVAVDGLYFIALRNRGMQKISSGELEQGLFDLSVVNTMGALDGEADGLKYWASLYLTGASYWDGNWAMAVEIFEELAKQMPYLSDGTGYTSTERLRIGLYRLGDEFVARGEVCAAIPYYRRSLEVGPNPDLSARLITLEQQCAEQAPSATPTPGDVTPPPDGDVTPVPPTP